MHFENICHTSVAEINQAEEIFCDQIRRYKEGREMSRQCLIRLAISAVWQAGRIYQMNLENNIQSSTCLLEGGNCE